ncbi:phasin family protein [Belnapia rosea]|uniref:phasin family protein n=1 Tax=Belnapia rosea TaxID=938405 RepID=UPI000888D81F|nr:phasin family protein [Belnapia rosea]SDB46494.1 Phasin protein [Belnapia rosea]
MDASRRGLQPLVPAEPPDLVALQRHALEVMTAANRLALGWLQSAAAQQAAAAQRTLEQMTAAARRLAAAEAAPEQAAAMLAMLEQARRLGLETAEEIAALMERLQGESFDLLDRAVRLPKGLPEEEPEA